jgi:hypothetical protein
MTPRLVCSQEQPQSSATTVSVSDALDHAKKAFALRKYEQAVEHYATALELLCVLPTPYPFLRDAN